MKQLSLPHLYLFCKASSSKTDKIGGIIKTENTTFQHPNKMMWFIFKQPLSPFGSVVMVR